MTSKNVSEDLVGQDRKLLSQIMELMPLDSLSVAKKQAFIDGRGGAASWLAWHLHFYQDKVVNQRILLVDRSIKFDAGIMSVPAFDNRFGGKWRSCDVCSSMMSVIPEISIDNIRLEPMLTMQESEFYLLDARVFQTFMKKKDRIPEEWKPKNDDELQCILFTGTVLHDTYNQAGYLALRYMSGDWRQDFYTESDIVSKVDHCFLRAVYIA